MFTGIVQDVGEIVAVRRDGGDLRLEIQAPHLDLAAQGLGASIAVAGVCLTVVAKVGQRFSVDVSQATLAATTANGWRTTRHVNLEAALRAGEPLGGHLVSGHVDGVGELLARRAEGRSERFVFRMPAELARYLARKGSVGVDGVSLTVNEATADSFTVNLVPHTLAVTTLGELAPGDRVNIEVDVLARYVERLYEMMRT